MRRVLAGVAVLLAAGGIVLAEETRGVVTKVEDGAITVRTRGDKDSKGEDKTFKVSAGIKITRRVGKDKEEVKLTLDELKVAVKVTNVPVTVVHDGETGTEIKVGFGGR